LIEHESPTASLRAVMWQIAMGVVSKTDENGSFILEACGQPNMKMARHFLEWQRPEKWGKRRKRHVPHNAGVLVIGGDVTKKPEYDTTRKRQSQEVEVVFAEVSGGTRCCFGATPLGGELPRSNGQTTAWPSALARA